MKEGLLSLEGSLESGMNVIKEQQRINQAEVRNLDASMHALEEEGNVWDLHPGRGGMGTERGSQTGDHFGG